MDDAMANSVESLLERMDAQIGEWLDDEPRDDWWNYQQDYAQARDAIVALIGE